MGELAVRELPLFPLPDLVLFPQEVLPLHIFEPRYRMMLRTVLAEDRRFGGPGGSERRARDGGGTRFGLRGPEAKTLLREVLRAVLDWRKTARQLRLSAGSVSAYASAFEHGFIEEAVRMSR
jgi:hypothetical protein